MALVPVYTDAFANSDGTQLATHNAGWSIVGATGGVNADATIDGNRLIFASGQYVIAIRNTGTYAQDQYAQVVVTGTLGSLTYPGLHVRASGSFGTFNSYEIGGNDSGWTIQKFVNNADDGTDLKTGSWSLTSGDEIRLEVTGGATTTISLYKNDVLVDSVIDSSSPHTSGRPGVDGFRSGSNLFFDDFEGGDITGGEPPTPGPTLHVIRSGIRLT